MRAFLENLVQEGEAKMERGEASALCYEDMITAWCDLLEKAKRQGLISDVPLKTVFKALAAKCLTPYPDKAVDKALGEIDAFGIKGLSTKVDTNS